MFYQTVANDPVCLREAHSQTIAALETCPMFVRSPADIYFNKAEPCFAFFCPSLSIPQ